MAFVVCGSFLVHFADVGDLFCVQKIVPPIIKSFADDDNRVRYYACEALYNIAKVKNLVCILTCFTMFCKMSTHGVIVGAGDERRHAHLLQPDFRCPLQAFSRR